MPCGSRGTAELAFDLGRPVDCRVGLMPVFWRARGWVWRVNPVWREPTAPATRQPLDECP